MYSAVRKFVNPLSFFYEEIFHLLLFIMVDDLDEDLIMLRNIYVDFQESLRG